jgi:uncharacterized membrane protein YqjE
MRALGILVVVLVVATIIIIWVMRHVVTPALTRRHIARIEQENERIDRLIQKGRERTPLK